MRFNLKWVIKRFFHVSQDHHFEIKYCKEGKNEKENIWPAEEKKNGQGRGGKKIGDGKYLVSRGEKNREEREGNFFENENNWSVEG